jgi:hypothetical protein
MNKFPWAAPDASLNEHHIILVSQTVCEADLL